MLGDPAAGGQLLEQRFVEPARRAVVDVLDRGLAVPQPCGTQSGLEALGIAIGGLAVEQQGQPFGVRASRLREPSRVRTPLSLVETAYALASRTAGGLAHSRDLVERRAVSPSPVLCCVNIIERHVILA